MITRNVLQRTFHLRYAGRYKGTAFTMERGERQYLISARHLFPFVQHNQDIEFEISRNSEWIMHRGSILLHPSDQVDIAVISLQQDLSPRLATEYTFVGMVLGAPCYFAGFPYGRFLEDYGNLNNRYPIPFVKRACFSTVPLLTPELHKLYLDGMNNPGFSGGPVAFKGDNSANCHICGVVKGYLPHEIEIQSPLGPYTYEENSGLVEVHLITNVDGIFNRSTVR